MLKKSLYFDKSFLQIRAFPFPSRLAFVVKKYVAILQLILLRRSIMKFRGLEYHFSSVSELGTLQSSIVDVYQELVETGLFKKSRPIILDVGANTGQFASAVKLLFPKAFVLSFEPDKIIYDKLVKNTKALGVGAVNMGLSDKKDKLKFYQHKTLSLISTFEKPKNESQYDTYELPVNSLDNIRKTYPQLKHVDLLKVDVEGFEMNVIRGAKNLLKNTDNILIEISLDRDSSDTNLNLLSTIYEFSNKRAKIIRTGRELINEKGVPFCQDVLIRNG